MSTHAADSPADIIDESAAPYSPSNPVPTLPETSPFFTPTPGKYDDAAATRARQLENDLSLSAMLIGVEGLGPDAVRGWVSLVTPDDCATAIAALARALRRYRQV